MRAGRVAAIAALAVGMLLPVAPVAAAESEPQLAAPGELEFGTCVDLVEYDGSGVVTDVTLASCDVPHDAEVYTRSAVHGEYPGADALVERAATVCDRAMHGTDVYLEETGLEAVYRIPDAEDFAANGFIECLAVDRLGAPLATTLAAADEAGTLIDPSLVEVTEVAVGECFTLAIAGSGEQVAVARVVDCAQPHDAQLYHREVIPEPYPGQDETLAITNDVCDSWFDPEWGVGGGVALSWTAWYATRASFRDSPTIECAAVHFGGAPLVGDVAGDVALADPDDAEVLDYAYSEDAYGWAALWLTTVVGITLVIVVVSLMLGWLLVGAGLTVLFGRVGIPPWRAWVPFLRTFSWLRLGGQPGHLTWLQLVPGGSWVTSIFLWMGMHRTGIAFGRDGGYVALGVLVPFAWALAVGNDRPYRPELIVAQGYPPPTEGTQPQEPEPWSPGPAPRPPASPVG
ncbi:hypothetical protein ARHIZOSPH14_30390 [Agromyces rhizosphaerae]|uniref:Septum formation-related domain-containing protein n=1 Tax=Agromyces rhizosphaerae TaxID=88374 RepID=A0A9W6CY47_9MICO|nr:DUF5684 domain-containing protein [Agromyces rhizosphaerae]GLI28797.1 hypothetical protein ARHIZOSPH14_30390 [Agromyces rhizosphaerae]